MHDIEKPRGLAARSPHRSTGGLPLVTDLVKWATAALLLAIAGTPALEAYGGDTHYYMRYAMALETCFDWNEAHVIASADLMVDKNRATTSEKEPFKTHNKIHWHAFGHSEERFNELWERVEAEEDPELQLVKLGQFLHFITDWESHYGYGVRMGHGLPTVFGRDPDSLANSRDNNHRMIGQALDYTTRVCAAQGRGAGMGDDPDAYLAQLLEDLQDEDLLDELYSFNSRKWKIFATRGKKGRAILKKNHRLIEELIERRGSVRPERNLPADFTPGDPDRGLPPPIGLRYDQGGELLAVYGVEIELAPEYGGSRMSVEEEERFEEREETELVDDLERDVQEGADLDLFSNVELEVEDVDLVAGGWRVEAEVRNFGRLESEPGTLDVFVVDVASEEVLGQKSVDVRSLAGSERLRLDVIVPSDGEPSKEVLIGATLQVFDLSAQGNDVWFVPWKESIRSEFGKKSRKKPREPGTVGILGAPKMWVDADGDFWLAIDALVSGGDSSRRLGDVGLTLRDEAGGEVFDLPMERTVWTSTADARRRIVPARSFHTPQSRAAFCEALRGTSAEGGVTLEVSIVGGNAEPAKESYPLPEGLARRARTFCTAR